MGSNKNDKSDYYSDKPSDLVSLTNQLKSLLKIKTPCKKNEDLTNQLKNFLKINSNDDKCQNSIIINNENQNTNEDIDKNKFNVKSGGIIFNHSLDKIIIILNRMSLEYNVPKWGLPKGHIEDTEEIHKCAEREIFEETGLKIFLNENHEKIKIDQTYYYIIVCSEEFKLNPNDKDEIAECKWVDINSLDELRKNIGLKVFLKEPMYSKVMSIANKLKHDKNLYFGNNKELNSNYKYNNICKFYKYKQIKNTTMLPSLDDLEIEYCIK